MPLNSLLKKINTYLPSVHEDRLKRAYVFAREAHKGQKRMDGSDYITHPLEVTDILADLHADEDTLVASLLHDVSEDTAYSLEDVEKRFGKKIGFLVDGVTKLAKVKYRHSMAERQVESLKKFFLHSARDFRIILIKLADRLHNMRTLHYVKAEKQLRIAKETMEIYVPIANLLGLWEVKSELENLCFRYIYPKEYEELMQLVQQTATNQNRILKETIQKVKRELKRRDIESQIQARPKGLYSIFRKMIDHEQALQDLNDLLALRILVRDKETCYRVLGIVHELFRPKSGRIKDYIAVPKANGYQSLHTTVFGVDGTPTEFQIRTHAMHLESEYGIAAHPWADLQKQLKKRSSWVKEVLELQKELKNNTDFLENLKIDVLQDRIFVFTPHGDVVDLPQGATGIDFAYQIHSDVGDRAIGLSRNGMAYALTTPLQTGDTVKIMTAKMLQIPKREWLEKVKTNLARNKIKAALKRQTKGPALQAGTHFLQEAFHRYGEDIDALSKSQRTHLLERFEISSWPLFLERVGRGQFSESEILDTLYTQEDLLGAPHRNTADYSTALSKIPYRKTGSRLIAPNNLNAIPFYRIRLTVDCRDRVGLLRDLGIELATLGVNIYQMQVEDLRNPEHATVRLHLVVEVVDFQQLRNVFGALESIDGILEFHRVPDVDERPAKSSSRSDTVS